MAYITFDDMQRLLLDQIRHGGAPLDYPEACREAMARGLVHEGKPALRREDTLRHLTDAEFEALLHQYPLGVVGADPVWPQGGNLMHKIYAIQHLHNPGSVSHAPKRFRVFYAYKGEFEMVFEKEYIQNGGNA